MLRYSRLSPCCFVIALIYLERLKRKEDSIFVTSTTFQRLLLVAVMVAAKFLDDYYESNKHWWNPPPLGSFLAHHTPAATDAPEFSGRRSAG
jgi:hypothetical protein